MPHAEESNMPNAMVNGEQTSSRFVSHLTSYPIISDSIRTFTSNPYGAKSVSLVHQASDTLLHPFLPYARKPYSYVQPYVARADQLADAGLGHVDKRVPIVKEETATIRDTLGHYALLPLANAKEAKNYLFGTWDKEYKRCGEHGGLVAGGKAAITTGLVVASDVGNWVGDLLRQSKKEGQGYVKEKTGHN